MTIRAQRGGFVTPANTARQRRQPLDQPPLLSPHASQLAQVNIGRLAAPTGSAELGSFFDALDPVNAAADAAAGFVWRLQTEAGKATEIVAFQWDRADSHGVLVNMSVWESVEALAKFVNFDAHQAIPQQRRACFSGHP